MNLYIETSYAIAFAKYLLVGVILYSLYLVHWLVIIPYRKRQYYKKYRNVKMVDKFYPMTGDITIWGENIEKGRGVLHHYIREVAENPDTDFRLMTLGERSILEITSPEAMDEFEKLVPDKVDRGEPKQTALANMMPTAFNMIRSTDYMNKRKNATVAFLGMNKVSSYIPKMIESVDTYVQPLKKGEEANFGTLSKLITFEIMGTQLLGYDYKSIDMDFKYVCPHTGSVSYLKFADYYMRVSDNEFEAFTSPLTKILKPLSERHLIEPYKTNHRNNVYMRQRLLDLILASKDPDSMYKTLMKTGEFASEDCVMDVISMVGGGFDTTSKSIASTLYLVKKNPEVYKKLMEEIRKNGLDQMESIPADEIRDVIHNCDYLAYVIKESLRYDTPGPLTLTYKAFEDVTVRGVDIPKGQELTIGIYYNHFNPKQWHRPTEFLPERFDPESELFCKPGTKSRRHPKSFNSFSMGKRKCIGQSLAMLSAKVVIVRILTTINYDIIPDLLNREKACFDMFSATDLKLIVN